MTNSKTLTKPQQASQEEEKRKEETKEIAHENAGTMPATIENGQLILTQKHLDLIKSQVAKNATPEEFDLFIMMAKRTRLDPLLKQLYFMKYKNNTKSTQAGCQCYGECTCGKAVYNPATYITSIDGYRIIAHRTGDFAGVDEPIYTRPTPTALPTHCTVKVWRKSSDRPFSATVKFAEYSTYQQMWAKMPETMIAKVAEAHALRKAFPQDLSGIYTQDEMSVAAKEAEIEPTKVLPPEPMKEGQKAYIYELIKKKGKTEQDLKRACTTAFKTDPDKMTQKQAETLILRLLKLPYPVREDELDPAVIEKGIESGLDYNEAKKALDADII